MTDTAAEFDVVTPGYLDVLSVGKGDLRLEVGTDPADRRRAKVLIEEMLRKGYAIFVETPGGQKRVKRFSPREMVYIVEDDPDPPKPAAKRSRTLVPVAGSRATAVGRMSGG